jgi:hypothetical protein
MPWSQYFLWLGHRLLTWGLLKQGVTLLNIADLDYRLSDEGKFFEWLKQQRDRCESLYESSDMLNWYRTYGESLFHAMNKTRGQQCQDPRDTVYALLSLVQEKEGYR